MKAESREIAGTVHEATTASLSNSGLGFPIDEPPTLVEQQSSVEAERIEDPETEIYSSQRTIDNHPDENDSGPVNIVYGQHANPMHSTNSRQDHIAALEERVQELEAKLATLSLIIQRQHRRRHSGSPTHPLSASPPASPPLVDDGSAVDDSIAFLMSMSTTNSGLLDSPFPQHSGSKGTHVRNLSFRVLHAEDFVANAHSQKSPQSSDDEGGLMPQTFDDLSIGEQPMLDVNLLLPETLPEQPLESHKDTVSSAPSFTLSSVPNDEANCSTKLSPSSVAPRPSNTTESTHWQNNENQKKGSRESGNVSENEPRMSPEKTKTSPSLSTNRSSGVTSLTTPPASQKLPSPTNTTNMKLKWLDYLNSVQESNYDTDKQMEEFVKVPSAVEALLSFGFWICVDSFLYTLTILPIRFVWSCLLLARCVLLKVFQPSKYAVDGPFCFHRRHTYQMIQMSIIYCIYKYVLKPIDISIIYHWIRVQNMVKLYLLIAIVEVFDRLMCSLGQDCLDSLYWNTTRRPRSSRLMVSILVVLAYTAAHSILLFVHVATMNVAMNSDDQALLSLLIGGNFAEIKSTVFKKYNKAHLFKITASDICERFKLALFLVLVLTLNLSQGMDKKMIYNYTHMCGIVWCAEWLSDWIKHAFITKSNYIASGVYSEYGLLLAGDNSGFGHEGENLDHSHAVVKRLGLAQIPLVCVMAKYIKEAYKYGTYERQPQTWMVIFGIITAWLLLLISKLFLGSFLLRISRMKLEAAPAFSKTNTIVAKKNN